MVEQIPEEAIGFVRSAFAQANRRATLTLARQPSAHEEMLDFQIFAALDEIGPVTLPGTGIAILIETHWLGGRRFFRDLWEIADLGVVIVLRRGGQLLWRKVGLLQSKRLYSREIPVHELEGVDYAIGVGRLVDRPENLQPLSNSRSFSFTEDCFYAQMASGSQQVRVISEYASESNVPVYYAFYNPPTIPYTGSVPRPANSPITEDILLGCRVISADDVHRALAELPPGRTPRFAEIARKPIIGSPDPFDAHGWPLETFVADEVMRCREGRLFVQAIHPDLHRLLYDRTGPMASIIQITIDLPGERLA